MSKIALVIFFVALCLIVVLSLALLILTLQKKKTPKLLKILLTICLLYIPAFFLMFAAWWMPH